MIDWLEKLDRILFLKINALHTPLLDTFMWHMSESWHTYLAVIVVAYAFYKKFSPKRALEFVVGCAIVVACANMSSDAVKYGVQRYRPTHNLEIKTQVHIVNDYSGGKYGFFSSHAANTFGLITFIFFCVNWIRIRFKLLLFAYPIIISYSRIYLGVHYPSDIFIGMLDGLLFGMLVYYIMNTYFFKTNEQTV
ncbi:phosphatase PAP2 family protein [Aurantibacillus circumpalustris]|uniref:phosphatase PAP2 family protein n=1 Tax=Aurantibacillus circumpalustris TaxID=3036359 RepID=UPI00295B8A21|nr:phosphatase PAP2 family protein [Aurantibacillus circumpalustris]